LTTLADGTNGEKSLVGGDTAFVTGHVSFTTSEGTTDTVKMTGAGTAAGQLAGSNLTATITAGTDRIADVKVDSVTEANKALGLIDAALSTINTQRAELGAVQSRLDSVVSNLMNVSENSAAAKSRIMDADFAAETAQLAKSQILQQAGISVLAQANAQPQNVLALLQ
jgi:flagellin